MNNPGVAIIGMAGRFPGARDIHALWTLLVDGTEAIRRVETPSRPNFVPAVATMAGVDLFDAAFFGIPPALAEAMDPQHRVFLEVAWEALEDAGYDPSRCTVPIGVYSGATANTYFAMNLASRPDVLERFTPVELNTVNANDFLPTRFSYVAGLTGPSHAVQCACSTSLVAVSHACQSLLDGQCDMALAGGVSINVTHLEGYRRHDGDMLSHDGHCRAFSASATGTVFGNGVGVVVLKPVESALRDRDHIYAVIIGSAVNNDGRRKVGYLAPGVDGQAEVIAEALAHANVPADSIGMIEGHGTGTPMGDPIEVRALTKAFRAMTMATQFCSIGSLKANIGHLDAAAGIAGLIKAALALNHRVIPGTPHVLPSNPDIDFAASPFYVHSETRSWMSTGPRRAGVSAFGVGGTNAHVVLEEAPDLAAATSVAAGHVLTLSARTAGALRDACRRLAEALARDDAPDLADVAYTLQVGRRRFRARQGMVCRNHKDAIRLLQQPSVCTEARADDARATALFFGDRPAGHPPIDFATLSRADRRMDASISACVATMIDADYDPQDPDGNWLVACCAIAKCLHTCGVSQTAIGGAPWRAGEPFLQGRNAGDLIRRMLGESFSAVAIGSDPAAWARTGRGVAICLGATRGRSDDDVTVDVSTMGESPAGSMNDLVAALWELGADVDWERFHASDRPRRVSLPTYPFEHQRYWIDRDSPALLDRHTPIQQSRAASSRPPLAVAYAAPSSDLQRALCALWSDALGVRGIGINDNFFDLGGDSMIAVRVAEDLSRRCGSVVPASVLFEGTTIRLLAEILDTEGLQVASAPGFQDAPHRV